jgi:hypothetical protein
LALLLLLAAVPAARSQHIVGIQSMPAMMHDFGMLDSLVHRHHQHMNNMHSVFSSDLLGDLYASEDTSPQSVVSAEVLGVGCTPIQTLHKSLTRRSNETVLQLRVSTTCSPSSFAALSDISAKVNDDGELTVHAVPAGADAFDQTISLPRHAEVSKITADYDEQTGVLRVSVPISTPSPISIPVSGAPAREISDSATSTAAASHEQVQDKKQGNVPEPAAGEVTTGTHPIPQETPEEARARERAVAAQIKRLEDELARIKASA